MNKKFIPRDISWLGFNARVLQEAADPSVPLPLKLRFLGIYSNNLDEFFRVRVGTLKRVLQLKDKDMSAVFYGDPQTILDQINQTVIAQQKEFNAIWKQLRHDMAKQQVFLRSAEELSPKQQLFVRDYFEQEVESNVNPILLDEQKELPYLRDESLYLGIAMRHKLYDTPPRYAIIEVPSQINGRFLLLPSAKGQHEVMLLEEVIKYNLPYIFSYFDGDEFKAHALKVTKDAEFDMDTDLNLSLVDVLNKGLKSRRKGKATRFLFDKHLDEGLVDFLTKKLDLGKRDSILPGRSIHNFKDFMDFPAIFEGKKDKNQRETFEHPAFKNAKRAADVLLKQDVLLHFPYHHFTPVIDLLREAAMDPDVQSIQLTAYRLASHSKISHALINAVRNGKEVHVMLELRARFDEEANLKWKEKLELEGVNILIGQPNQKIHAKACIIKKKVGRTVSQYGFISTGNFNEKTAKVYADHMLLTSNRHIMAGLNKLFNHFKTPQKCGMDALSNSKNLLCSPLDMRAQFLALIDFEIAQAQQGHKAKIMLKLNALSDKILIEKLYEAAKAGVKIDLIIRGVYCANFSKFQSQVRAISIVDEYLEHSRILYFYHGGQEAVYLSSADWMPRNLDLRIELAVKITQNHLIKTLKDVLNFQMADNQKARLLDPHFHNHYVEKGKKNSRSQLEIANYLKHLAPPEPINPQKHQA
jgi:polyphosphate kinase